MKTPHLAIIFSILLFGTVPAWAFVSLDAYLPISGAPVTPEFKFDKTYKIDYQNGSKLKDALAGRNLTVTCSANSTDSQAVKQMMEGINSEISTAKSPVLITHLGLDYMFSLRGTPTYAVLDYLISLRPTMTGYLLNDGHGRTPSTLDASWISFSVNDPVVIDTKNCNSIEINYPLNTIKDMLPDVYSAVYNTQGEGVFDQAFNQKLIDSTPLLQTPLDRWDSLFDPSYIPNNIAGPLLPNGQKVAATAFSTGLSQSFQSNQDSLDTDFVADARYHISRTDRPSVAGTINVEGHANVNKVQGGWTFITSTEISTCCIYPVHWYDNIPGWAWSGIVAGAVIAGGMFYFRRYKE